MIRGRRLRRSGGWAAAGVFSLGLSACAVGPDYTPPAPPAGAAGALISIDPRLETSQGAADAWWRLYQDPLLDQLIEEAFVANTDLAAAEANLSSARAALEASRAGRLPATRVEAGAVYGRDAATDEILEISGHAPQTTWLFDDLFDVSYELDLFGRVRRSIQASKADAQGAQASRDGLKITVAAETARAYAQICTLGEQLAVARRSLEIVAHEARITEDRHDAGANSRFDVVRVEGLEAQVKSGIPTLEGQRKSALFQLTALLGRTPANAPSAVLACVTPPRLSGLTPVGDGAALLKRRPDVRQADRRLAGAIARVGVATADLYPRVKLAALYGGAASSVPGLGQNSGLTWGVGPSVSWAFPNQAEPRARVKQAKAAAAAALAGFDSVVLQALKETEQTLATYGAELDRRQSLAVVQARSSEAFDLAQGQFTAGSLSTLDLLTTEQSLVAADASVAASDAAMVQDQISLFKALGGGWSRPAP